MKGKFRALQGKARRPVWTEYRVYGLEERMIRLKNAGGVQAWTSLNANSRGIEAILYDEECQSFTWTVTVMSGRRKLVPGTKRQ